MKEEGLALPELVVDLMHRTSLLRRKRAARKAHFRGKEFEQTVAGWARLRFKADEVKTNERVDIREMRPFQIGVHICARVPGSMFSKGHIWLECKNLHRRINRNDVMDLVGKKERVHTGSSSGYPAFGYLGMVSTSGFDPDAIEVANGEGVACIRYYDGRYELVNKVSWPWKVYWPWQ